MAPRSRIRLSPAVRPTAVTSSPTASARKKAVLVMASAWRFSLAPSIRDTRLDAPVPNQNPRPLSTITTENTTPTAAVALVPMRPTKKVSAML